MNGSDPVLTVVLVASGAALVAALGVLPQALTGRLPLRLLGWANALAAGLMLGVAHSLLDRGLDTHLVEVGLGALVGVGAVMLARRGTGTEGLDLNRQDERDPLYATRVVLVDSLHSAWEGVAIGVAMLVSIPFGISMAVTLAVHNVPEAMLLTSVVAGRGMRAGQTAALAVATNASQVLFAVIVFVAGSAVPALVPWGVGFAAGALVQLLLIELLPESYRQAGATGIALVTLVAMGMVVALGGVP